MQRTIAFGLMLVVLGASTLAQAPRVKSEQQKLAEALSSTTPGERRNAIEAIVKSPNHVLPWLLEWSKCRPGASVSNCQSVPHVAYTFTSHGLPTAMAEIFGRLRVKEAVPFLIETMRPESYNVKVRPMNTDLPAIKALIEIGPDATPALIVALSRFPPSGDCRVAPYNRLGILTTLAFIDDPRARAVLEDAAQEPGWCGDIAREGLHQLALKAQPR